MKKYSLPRSAIISSLIIVCTFRAVLFTIQNKQYEGGA